MTSSGKVNKRPTEKTDNQGPSQTWWLPRIAPQLRALLCQSLVPAFAIQKCSHVLTPRGEPLGVRDVRVFIPMMCIFYLKCLLSLFLHTCVSQALDLRGHFNGVQRDRIGKSERLLRRFGFGGGNTQCPSSYLRPKKHLGTKWPMELHKAHPPVPTLGKSHWLDE